MSKRKSSHKTPMTRGYAVIEARTRFGPSASVRGPNSAGIRSIHIEDKSGIKYLGSGPSWEKALAVATTATEATS